MATKARQQYFADEVSLSKEKREFSIADEIQQKIDSIEPGAQVNKIETVKVNGTALVPDANKAVNIDVPEVIDNLYTVDSDNALSAKQGKLLYDYIQNIASRGRFLSNWNSATGLPMTNPSESPYPYKSGDYFVVSNVAGLGGTNYRPDGGSYIIGQASTVVETEDVNVSDFYFYDGTNWLLLSNSGRQIAIDTSLSTTSTNPVENRVITNALNGKQDTLVAGNHIDITNNVISAEGFQEELTAGDNISITASNERDTKGPAPSGFHIPTSIEWDYLAWDIMVLQLNLPNCEAQGMGTYFKMPAAGERNGDSGNINGQGTYGNYWSSTYYSGKNARYLNFSTTSNATASYNSRAGKGEPIRCFKNTPVNPDSSWTTLFAGSGSSGIFHNATLGLISISGDGTTWITMMDKNLGATTVYNRGDTLTEANCGYYFQWGNNHGFPFVGNITTSSTQVNASAYGPGNYYSSNEFITNPSSYWDTSNNPNLWGGVTQGTWTQTVISATDTTYTAGTGISIDANNVISNTQTSAQWGNITGTLSNQTDLQNALDSKVNLGTNQVFDSTVVEIGKWEQGQGGASSGHHITLDPNGEVSTYNVTTGGHNEATLGSGILTVIKNTAIGGNEEAVYSHESIVADNGTDTETYNFFGNNRIARLSDVGGTYSAGNGISIDANNEISNTLPGPTIAAAAPTGTEGALWYDTTNDVLMAHDGTAWKEAGTQMKVLSYGSSTWQDFINAYNENAIVYCRASSNSNPATGNQTRMAFMAYVNSTTPTEVEFQYYRSRSDHNTAANQLDQVFVYKLTSASGGTWTVTERNTGAKAVAGTGISLGWGSGNMTISADTTTLATQTDLNSKQDTLVSGTNIKTINNESLLGSGNITISAPTYTAGENITIDQNNEISATDTTYTAGEGITIGTIHPDNQGPCEDGFHIPFHSEHVALLQAWTGLGFSDTDSVDFITYFHIAPGFTRSYNGTLNGGDSSEGFVALWSAEADTSAREVYVLSVTLSTQTPEDNYIEDSTIWGISTNRGYAIRAFKDTPVVPDNTWTTVYQGTGSAGIYHNSTLGLISVSSNGTNWITLKDKNEGATTVWNYGDTITSSNAGDVYQWGNNHAFPTSGTITTSSTRVDASAYGPGNYYDSSTFVTKTNWGDADWDTSQNRNLWGGVSQGTWIGGDGNTIINTGVLSVNGSTGAVTVNEFTAANGGVKVFDLPSVNDNITDIVNWLTSGGTVIIKDANSVYYTTSFIDTSFKEIVAYSWDGYTQSMKGYNIAYNSSKVVTTVTDISQNIYSFNPGGTATTGYVVTKTAGGYEWAAPTGGIQLAPNTELNVKYHRYGSQASYDNLNQYYTDTANDTAYFTI